MTGHLPIAAWEDSGKVAKHWSEVAADDAIDFLKAASQSKNPFFMYVAFNAPHDPRQAPQAFLDKYPVSRIAIPAQLSG